MADHNLKTAASCDNVQMDLKFGNDAIEESKDTKEVKKKQNSNGKPKPSGKKLYSPQVGKSWGELSGLCKGIETLDLLDLEKAPQDRDPLIIGVCGGSSSGKSTVVAALESIVDSKISVVCQHHFYKPPREELKRKITRGDSFLVSKIEKCLDTNGTEDEKQNEEVEPVKKEEKSPEPKEKNPREPVDRNNSPETLKLINTYHNFDEPDAVDWDLMIECIDTLIAGKPFDRPNYDKEQKIRTDKTTTINPYPVILVEGFLIFNNPEVLKRLKLKVFVETDADVRLSRRVLKEIKNFGKKTTLKELLYQYEKFVKPAYEKYVEPSKKHANIIIPNFGFSKDILNIHDMMVSYPAIQMLKKEMLLFLEVRDK